MAKVKRLSREEECKKCKKHEARKPVIIGPEERKLYLPFSSDNVYEHMLMPQHVEPVRALLRKLEEFGNVSYLGGGVVESAVFRGDKKYSDIDVLTVYNDSLDSTDRFMDLVDSATQPLLGYKDKLIVPRESYVTINGQGFRIETNMARDAYMRIYSGITRRARFIPLRTLEQIKEMPKGDGTKGIHLMVIGNSTFKENFAF